MEHKKNIESNNLQAAFELFIEEYSRAKKEDFSKHPLKEFMLQEMVTQIESIVSPNQRYQIKGSVGQGNWAKVPWIAIFDTLITTSAQTGYYIVYLMCEDLSGFYLSLNQGVTTIRETYGVTAKEALTIRAKDYCAQLGNKHNSEFIKGPIDLKVTSSTNIASDYEAGAIYSKFYTRSNIPSDKYLKKDLSYLLDLYFSLSRNSLSVNNNIYSEDELNLAYEDLTNIREHKRIERNQKLSKAAKKFHGYICKVCNFNFYQCYGDIGKDYIEAHHLIPLHKIKEQKIALNPKKDFTVLCANCHRMIHKTEFVDNIDKFRAKYLNK